MTGAQFKQNACEFVKLRLWEITDWLRYSEPLSWS